MKVYINRNGVLRDFSQPPTFLSSIIGTDGYLYINREDKKDNPNIYNRERYSVMSLKNEEMIISSPPDKNIPNHHSSILISSL